MINHERTMKVAGVVAGIAAAGTLAVIGPAKSVTAEPLPAVPEPPADPTMAAPPPMPATPTTPTVAAPLEQGGSLLPLLPADQTQILLGQNPVPSVPGSAPGVPPDLSTFNGADPLQQNIVPSAPGEGTIFDVAPGAENAEMSRLDFARRLWRLYEAGYLRGGLLGQIPQDQLGAPVPGTAPPPGTSIPPGITGPAPGAVPPEMPRVP